MVSVFLTFSLTRSNVKVKVLWKFLGRGPEMPTSALCQIMKTYFLVLVGARIFQKQAQ